MSKATKRKRASRKKYLAKLSRRDLSQFERTWEMRVQSWLIEINRLAKSWRNGDFDSRKLIFGIFDEARDILSGCEGLSPYYVMESLDAINNECCAQVGKIIDKRLYRLSNYDQIPFKSRNTDRKQLKNT